MVSIFLSNKNEKLCVVNRSSSYAIYRLEAREKFGVNFYDRFNQFKVFLERNEPLSEQPYGLIGSASSIIGRDVCETRKVETRLASSERKVAVLEQPKYVLLNEYKQSEFKKMARSYSLEKEDFPYASVSTSSSGVGQGGDDFYLNTLFFMTKGYGILTETSIIAGRDIEDCCSPHEVHYKAYKVKLDVNPIKMICEKDMIPGAEPVICTVETNPRILPLVIVNHNEKEKINKIDKAIKEAFIALLPKHKDL